MLQDGGHILDSQFLVEHLLAIERDSQKPPGLLWNGIRIGNQEVRLNHIHILGDVGRHHVGVVEDLCHGRDRSQVGVLDGAAHALCHFLSGIQSVQVHDHRRRSDVGRDVENLLETRNTKGDVLGRDTGKMERVQGHLGGRLADGLRCQDSHHLTGGNLGPAPSVLDLSDDVVQGQAVQAQLDGEALEGQPRTQLSLEQDGRIVVGFDRD